MPGVTPDDVLEALEAAIRDQQQPVVATAAIADRLPIGEKRVRDLLNALEATAPVRHVEVGPTHGWYHTNVVTITPVRPHEPTDEPTSEPTAGSGFHGDARGPGDVSDTTTVRPDEPTGEPTDEPAGRAAALEQLDVPGQRDGLEADRRDVLRRVLEYLDEHGDATAGELRDALYQEHPAGYDSDRSWWKNFVSPALSELEDAGHTELLKPSRGLWTTTNG